MHYRKTYACFSRIAICSIKTSPDCSWRRSLKHTSKCLLCESPLFGLPQWLFGLFSSLPPLDMELAQAGRHGAPLSSPQSAQFCDLGALFQMAGHMQCWMQLLLSAGERLQLDSKAGRMCMAWEPPEMCKEERGSFGRIKHQCKQESACPWSMLFRTCIYAS